jgi:hypothetical protein
MKEGKKETRKKKERWRRKAAATKAGSEGTGTVGG